MKRIDIVRLQEECAEVIQVLCKIQRFGISDHRPDEKLTNLDKLHQEVADVQVCIENLGLNENLLADWRRLKRAKLKKNAHKELI